MPPKPEQCSDWPRKKEEEEGEEARAIVLQQNTDEVEVEKRMKDNEKMERVNIRTHKKRKERKKKQRKKLFFLKHFCFVPLLL